MTTPVGEIENQRRQVMPIQSGVQSFSNQELRRFLRMSRQSNGLRAVLTSTWFWWPQLIADCAASAIFLLQSTVKKLLNNQNMLSFCRHIPLKLLISQNK